MEGIKHREATQVSSTQSTVVATFSELYHDDPLPTTLSFVRTCLLNLKIFLNQFPFDLEGGERGSCVELESRLMLSIGYMRLMSSYSFMSIIYMYQQKQKTRSSKFTHSGICNNCCQVYWFHGIHKEIKWDSFSRWGGVHAW